MRLRELIDFFLGRPPPPVDDEGHIMLDREESKQADRLSKLTGKRRDQVLAEAYDRARRASLLEEDASYRRPSR